MLGLKITYWVTTGLVSALMLMSASMYFFNYPEAHKWFVHLGFPTYLIYPLATAKVLGVLAIVTRRSNTLRVLAYAGFFYDMVLAALAHTMAGDGPFGPSHVGLILLVSSYIAGRRVFGWTV